MGLKCCQNMSKICTFGINGFFRFAVMRKNHVTRGPDCDMCSIFTEKQACIARHQPSELFDNVLVQAVLSPILRINKQFGLKLWQVSLALNHYYTTLERTKNDTILLYYTQ